jgi:hypothetical protein
VSDDRIIQIKVRSDTAQALQGALLKLNLPKRNILIDEHLGVLVGCGQVVTLEFKAPDDIPDNELLVRLRPWNGPQQDIRVDRIPKLRGPVKL